MTKNKTLKSSIKFDDTTKTDMTFGEKKFNDFEKSALSEIYETTNQLLSKSMDVKVFESKKGSIMSSRSRGVYGSSDVPAFCYVKEKEIYLNYDKIITNIPKTSRVPLTVISILDGLNYHELAHLLYTQHDYGKINNTINGLNMGKEALKKVALSEFRKVSAIVEDTRIETLFSNEYPKASFYFVVTSFNYFIRNYKKMKIQLDALIASASSSPIALKSAKDDATISLLGMYMGLYGRKYFMRSKQKAFITSLRKDLAVYLSNTQIKKIETMLDAFILEPDNEKRIKKIYDLTDYINTLTKRGAEGLDDAGHENNDTDSTSISESKEQTEKVKKIVERINKEIEEKEDSEGEDSEDSEGDESEEDGDSEDSEDSEGEGADGGGGDKAEGDADASSDAESDEDSEESEEENEEDKESKDKESGKGKGAGTSDAGAPQDSTIEKIEKEFASIVQETMQDKSFRKDLNSRLKQIREVSKKNVEKGLQREIDKTPDLLVAKEKLTRILDNLKSELSASFAPNLKKGKLHISSYMNSKHRKDFRYFANRKLNLKNKATIGVSILMDSSGSVDHYQWAEQAKAIWICEQAIEKSGGYAEVIEFSSLSRVLKYFSNKGDYYRSYGGGTHTDNAVKLATLHLQDLEKKKRVKNKYMFIFTDGSPANQDNFVEACKEARKQGIVLFQFNVCNNNVEEYVDYSFNTTYQDIPKLIEKILPTLQKRLIKAVRAK